MKTDVQLYLKNNTFNSNCNELSKSKVFGCIHTFSSVYFSYFCTVELYIYDNYETIKSISDFRKKDSPVPCFANKAIIVIFYPVEYFTYAPSKSFCIFCTI